MSVVSIGSIPQHHSQGTLTSRKGGIPKVTLGQNRTCSSKVPRELCKILFDYVTFHLVGAMLNILVITLNLLYCQ